MMTSTLPKQNFQSISDYLYHYATHTPDKDAMVLGDSRMPYLEMANKVDHCARALVGAGVTKGDRVATLCTTSPDFFILFLATASLGAIWVGLNSKYTLDELSYVVCDAKPKIIISRLKIGNRNFTEDLLALKQRCSDIEYVITLDEDDQTSFDLTYDDFLGQFGGMVDGVALKKHQATVQKQDSALIVYTSGTTGKPKGALLPHRGLIDCCEVQNDIYPCSDVRLINFLPINHIGCVGDLSCITLVAGGTLFFMEQFDPAASLQMIEDEKITLWGGVPTTFQMCLGLPDFAQYDLSSVELIIWAGAAAPRELVAALRKITPYLSNCYGQTETVGSVTFVKPCDDIELLSETVGTVPEGYEVRIVDGAGQDVVQGETGEIVVRGDFVMNGYWGKPEETAATIDQDGWLHSGDLGFLRKDNYISLVGRIKEVFKSGGYNVYPREIEQVLESFPGVEMSAVIGIEDALYNEVGHAFILDPSLSVTEEAIRTYCRDHLANYKIPKNFTIKAQLPMLPIGKIDKMKLKKKLNDVTEA